MFKIQAAIQLGLNQEDACTSQLCSWKKSRRQATPAPLSELSFKRPKKNQLLPTVKSPTKSTLTGFTAEDPIRKCSPFHKEKLLELQKIAPTAVVFKSISLELSEHSDSEDTDTGDENEKSTLPDPLTSLYEPSLINNDISEETSNNLYKTYVAAHSENQFQKGNSFHF